MCIEGVKECILLFLQLQVPNNDAGCQPGSFAPAETTLPASGLHYTPFDLAVLARTKKLQYTGHMKYLRCTSRVVALV